MISIIVPVYNVEKYLSKCVESIVAQTFSDWELLLIDDGSKDNSGALCDEYADADDRVSVFHKENGGVSSARNLGLEKACGDWVMFVDADDWISNDCLEICLHEAIENDLQLLQFGFYRVFEDNRLQTEVKRTTVVMNGGDYVANGSLNVCVWGAFINRKIIVDNNLRFDEHLKLAEDQLFILSIFRIITRAKFLSLPLYFYLQRESSATHNMCSADIYSSCIALHEFSKQWPPIQFHCDTHILYSVVYLILLCGQDVKSISALYLLIQGKQCDTNVSTLTKVFYYSSKLSLSMAYYIIKMLFYVKQFLK